MSASTADGTEPRPFLTVPTLAEGVELVGEYRNSGYREPPQLVSLGNRQLVRLPRLLFLVVRALRDHGHRAGAADDPAAVLRRVAAAVTDAAEAIITPDQVIFLVDNKLAPLGVTTYSDGTPPPVVKANPFLGLRFKAAVVPERVTWFLGGLFGWLFRPALLVALVAVFMAAEVWLFVTQSASDALAHTILTPAGILTVIGLAVGSCVFHEIGHVTACRYGGARPGVMGCGIYLVWPAFYTDITDSYRLGRAGRLRTDLGGVYFNAIFVIVLAAVYARTGYAPLLVATLSVNLEILQQLLPTLRFDGYYIMSDLVGIPDLFAYIGPIVRRTVLRRPADDRLRALKRWPQVIVTLWVLIVIPALALQLTVVGLHVPGLIVTDARMIRDLAEAVTAGAGPLEVVASGLHIFLLLLPLLGLALLAYRLLKSIVTRLVRFVQAPVSEAREG